MATATNLTLAKHDATTNVFALSQKDNGYQKYLFVPTGGKLTEAHSFAMKLNQPAKLTDGSVIGNRIIALSPNFDAEGLPLAPNVIEIKCSMLASATELEKQDLYERVVSFLKQSSIKAQVCSSDNLV